MARSVFIGCKLPHGITLDHPLDPSKKVTLSGLNKAAIIGADHSITEIDGEFWGAWKTAHAEFPALKSGAIFEAKSAADVVAKAKELAKEVTGFEPMAQNAQGVSPAELD